MDADRREFLKRAGLVAAAGAAGVPPALPMGETDAPAQAGRPVLPSERRELDQRMLRALGDAILPESLGAQGRRRAVDAFTRWVREFAPVVEEMHGYGSAEITFTPANPAPGWDAQLHALWMLSYGVAGESFTSLGIAARREVVAAALDRYPGSRIPANPIDAPHVALALLAHWTSASATHDLAYGVRIGRTECRPLAETSRRPLPLAPDGP
jgi:hypothetical protein